MPCFGQEPLMKDLGELDFSGGAEKVQGEGEKRFLFKILWKWILTQLQTILEIFSPAAHDSFNSTKCIHFQIN